MKPGESMQAVQSLRELPQTVAPARDLWPGIQSRLAPRRRSWAIPASLAAGPLLVSLGFIVGLQVRDAGMPGSVAAVMAQRESGAVIRAALMVDPDYQRQRDELLRALPERLASLPPESQQRVRDSLLAVQTAMQNIEAELGRNSGNVLLQEMLVSTCQEELRVLTAVSDADGSNQEI